MGVLTLNVNDDKVICYNCNKLLEHEAGQKVFRNEDCPQCEVSMRCCRMCKHYDKTTYNECREPVAERIIEKEKSTFCDHFLLAGAGNGGTDKNSLLDAASSLFKN